MRAVKPIFILFISIFFVQCSSEMVNLDKSKREVAFYYESGEYSKELKEILNDASKKISKNQNYENAAVVFDVDETVLSNYEHIKETGYGYVPELWYNWVNSAKAPAIPEVLEFYKNIVDKNIKIIFLTGRKSESYEATIKNLKETGFTEFDTLICKSKTYDGAPAGNYKRIERTVMTEKGYKIIACVGDQWSDMQGENTGEKIKLPNYLYYIE